MKPLSELVKVDESGMLRVLEWIDAAIRPIEVLPASERRDEALYRTQVSIRSPMGAIVYETGGILIDRGWLRVLGSGSARLTRTLPDWNEGRSDGLYLIADDVVGGFFAINGGALGPDTKNIYYFAPDSLNWEPLEIGYSDFLNWCCVGKLDEFYDWIRWPTWEEDITTLHGDRCYGFYPFLFTEEGQGGKGNREEITVEEAWGLQMEIRKQLESS